MNEVDIALLCPRVGVVIGQGPWTGGSSVCQLNLFWLQLMPLYNVPIPFNRSPFVGCALHNRFTMCLFYMYLWVCTRNAAILFLDTFLIRQLRLAADKSSRQSLNRWVEVPKQHLSILSVGSFRIHTFQHSCLFLFECVCLRVYVCVRGFCNSTIYRCALWKCRLSSYVVVLADSLLIKHYQQLLQYLFRVSHQSRYVCVFIFKSAYRFVYYSSVAAGPQRINRNTNCCCKLFNCRSFPPDLHTSCLFIYWC